MKYISVIKAEIESIAPLYISGDEGILLDDETGMAYIPATTITGAFRAYLDFIERDSEELFGDARGNSIKSSIYIKDSFAKIKGFEVRTGVQTNYKMGSSQAGSKVEKLYLKKGLIFQLDFKIDSKSENAIENKGLIYKCLNALDETLIRIGGNKSNGLGIFKVKKVEEIDFDFNNKRQWIDYIKDDYSNIVDVSKKVLDKGDYTDFVKFEIKGSFTTPVLIGSSENYDPKDVDNKNIMSDDDYIIPGSSFKGTLRSRIERISNYLGDIDISRAMFGDIKTDDGQKNALSRVLVTESIIDTSDFEDSDYNRINIDRFTGGARKTGLMNDSPVQGSIEFSIIYKKSGNIEEDKYAIGIIALALKDFGSENLSIGGDASIGRGRFKAENMTIIEEKVKIEINFTEKTISNKEYLDKCIKTVKTIKQEVNHAEGI